MILVRYQYNIPPSWYLISKHQCASWYLIGISGVQVAWNLPGSLPDPVKSGLHVMYIVHYHDVTTVYKTTRVLRKLILRSVILLREGCSSV